MDIKSFKISNRIILSGILTGLIINFHEVGWYGIIQCFCGVVTPVILLFLLFLFKVLGAGDIKLFSVIGSFLGITFVLQSIVLSFFIAAILSVIHLIKYRQAFDRLQHLVNYFQTMYQRYKTKPKGSMEIVPYYDLKKDGYKGVIHYSIAILGAFLIQICLHYY